MAVDAAGGVWFAENSQPGAIGHYDGTTTTRTPVPSGAVPHEITVATDGDIWFTERFSPQGVGRLEPATNAIAEFPLTNVGPQSIAPAPGGAVWFTQTTTGNAARIDDGGPGTYVEGKAVKGSEPFGIVVAADGTPRYTETGGEQDRRAAAEVGGIPFLRGKRPARRPGAPAARRHVAFERRAAGLAGGPRGRDLVDCSSIG